jgi:TonB family protein
MRAVFLFSALLISHGSLAQSSVPLIVSSEIAEQHLIEKVEPVYPPIAKAAHVQGSVRLQVDIDTTGHVIKTKPISGPAMLVGAAIDCVKAWMYKPFENAGQPVPATTVVALDFTLGMPADPSDEKTAQTYFPLSDACHKAANGGGSAQDQAAVCSKAAEVANRFSSGERFIERRSAYVYASTALRRNKQLKEALAYANKAVAVVEQGHDDGSGSSAAYGVRAQAEAELGDLISADRDLTKGEDFERSAIEKMGKMNGDFTKRQYLPVLKGMLGYHAQILSALGNQAAAETKSAEAAKL